MSRLQTSAPTTVDRETVRAWLEGWALSRGLPSPELVNGALRVTVGWPDQRVRYVLHQACPETIQDIVERETEPHALIKVCAKPSEVVPHLTAPWQLRPLSWMMQKSLVREALPSAPEGYSSSVEHEGVLLIARAWAKDGTLAASGRMALNGTTASVDQIVTHELHRRRGLGRTVMAQLEQSAWREGVEFALLVATQDGRELYRTLGWDELSPYVTAANTPLLNAPSPAPPGDRP